MSAWCQKWFGSFFCFCLHYCLLRVFCSAYTRSFVRQLCAWLSMIDWLAPDNCVPCMCANHDRPIVKWNWLRLRSTASRKSTRYHVPNADMTEARASFMTAFGFSIPKTRSATTPRVIQVYSVVPVASLGSGDTPVIGFRMTYHGNGLDSQRVKWKIGVVRRGQAVKRNPLRS